MPPPPPVIPAGTQLLQTLLTYIEAFQVPGGTCVCGSVLDIAISVQAPATLAPRFDPLQQIFVVECLKCKRTFEVTMEDLARWDGVSGPTTAPPLPEDQWPACTICHAKYLPKPAALKDVCEACSTVSKDLGQIVDVREQETLL